MRCRPDFRSGSEKRLNFWAWLEISRGQDQGPVREITLIITSPERSNRGEGERNNALLTAIVERERGIGMIAAEQSYSLQMGDHDS